MTKNIKRYWLVRWVYATVAMHFVVGALLPLIANAGIFDNYHRSIEAFFWGGTAPLPARMQQVWWISLFGPTVQSAAIWMGALVRIADIQKSIFAWATLIVGIVIWAPQDILISLQADCWAHLWVDIFAVAVMLPPLVWLLLIDLKALRETT